MDVLYIICANCAGFVIPAVLVILLSAKKFKAQTNLRWLKMGHCRLASVIYVGWASRRRLLWLTYDGPPGPS
jgi:hypothetical protein